MKVLTLTESNGDKVHLNPAHIVSVEATKTGSKVLVAGPIHKNGAPRTFTVTETTDVVVDSLNKAFNAT